MPSNPPTSRRRKGRALDDGFHLRWRGRNSEYRMGRSPSRRRGPSEDIIDGPTTMTAAAAARVRERARLAAWENRDGGTRRVGEDLEIDGHIPDPARGEEAMRYDEDRQWIGHEDLRRDLDFEFGQDRILARDAIPPDVLREGRQRRYADGKRAKLQAFENIRMQMLEHFLPHYLDPDDELLYPEGLDGSTFQCGCGHSRVFTTYVDLLTRRGKERVKLKAYSSHPATLILIMQGFMPSDVNNASVAFQLCKMRRVSRYREHGGISFQAGYEAEFFTRFDSVYLIESEKPPFYKQFLDAMREFTILEHLVWHGRITPTLVERHGVGRTKCPCLGAKDSSGILIQMCDGYFSARKLDKEHGGGGNYGESAISAEYFKTANEDYRRNAGAYVSNEIHAHLNLLPEAMKINQEARRTLPQFSGLSADTKSPMQYMKLTYAVAALEDIKRDYPNRKIAISYDISCKLCIHLRKFGLEHPYIMMLPKLHAYCHDHGCQSKFSPHVLMGLGHLTGKAARGSGAYFPKASKHRAYMASRKTTKIRQQLRMALDIEAASIRSIERIIQKRQGTTMTAKLRVKLKKHRLSFYRLLQSYNSDSEEQHQQALDNLPLSARAAGLESIEREDADACSDIGVDSDGELEDERDGDSDHVDTQDQEGPAPLPYNLTSKEIFEELDIRKVDDNIAEYWRNLEDLVLHMADSKHARDHFNECEAFWNEVLDQIDVTEWGGKYYADWARMLVESRKHQEAQLKEAWGFILEDFKPKEYFGFSHDHYKEVEAGITSLLGGQMDHHVF
ncbi:hypothetical protein BC829DRAFT_448550 [Chytridium lagenaria]|nr:hypothetical protein BC829DRAFT_448550 [Chytridium lagenaria]